MSRRFVLAVLLVLGAASCSQRDELERQLAKLKPGEAFPGTDRLPEALRGKPWKAVGVHKTSSDLPMRAGGPLCNAYSTLVDAEGSDAPQNLMAVFCGGKLLPLRDGSAFFVTPVPGGKQSRSRSDAQFFEALAPGEVIVWHSQRTVDDRGFLSVRERAWRERNGQLEQILEVTGVDPTQAKTELPEGKRQMMEAQANYAPGFVGSNFPKTFAARGRARGRPYVLRYDYTEAGGYRSAMLIPTQPRSEPGTEVFDGGAAEVPEADAGVTP